MYSCQGIGRNITLSNSSHVEEIKQLIRRTVRHGLPVNRRPGPGTDHQSGMKTRNPIPEKGEPGSLAEDNPPNDNEESREKDKENNQNKG
ncbi:hypothetical protein M514_28085 [Trichuris suis]|uniref:Uncharacterized protein n=1 Tax=Trichuris suis TaxID=68888 RepID=A0A085MR87_9BILA|nr:hypothetical protein M514_28085 [Trichuris suis]